MNSITKLPRVVLNATLVRGRKRIPRLLMLLVISGVMFAGFRQGYQQLAQRKHDDENVKQTFQKTVDEVNGNGELRKVSELVGMCVCAHTHMHTHMRAWCMCVCVCVLVDQ